MLCRSNFLPILPWLKEQRLSEGRGERILCNAQIHILCPGLLSGHVSAFIHIRVMDMFVIYNKYVDGRVGDSVHMTEGRTVLIPREK